MLSGALKKEISKVTVLRFSWLHNSIVNLAIFGHWLHRAHSAAPFSKELAVR